MIIKQYLPFRFSREGCIPDRIFLQFCGETAAVCEEILLSRKKTAHFYLAKDGCVMAFTPLSAAANLLGPTGEPAPEMPQFPAARRGILILIEGKEKILSEEQKEPLIRLLKGIQKEILRIYGEKFAFCRGSLCSDTDTLPLDELLDQANFRGEERVLFRVKTGNYRHRRDAEDSVERLQRAGIAAYITEVRET